MNLEKLTQSLQAFESNFDSESKEAYLQEAVGLRKKLDEVFPAVSELDRAAIAWFTCEVLAAMRHLTVAQISDILTDSAMGYALLTGLYLGWIDDASNR